MQGGQKAHVAVFQIGIVMRAVAGRETWRTRECPRCGSI
jgi:hypothetical protein